jgi:hypothetical protein
MTRRSRRRAWALAAPVPLLLVMALLARALPTASLLRSAIEFPAAAIHAVLGAAGLRSLAWSAALAAGLIYLVLAVLASAIACPRDPLRGSVIRALGIAVLLGAAVYLIASGR